MGHAAVAEGAGRFDHLHGDEQYAPTSIAQQLYIDTRAEQIVEERITQSPTHFHDLLCGLDLGDYEGQLQRALANLDRACKGESIATIAILTALSQIQRTVRSEARKAWGDEAAALAELEVA